MSILDIIGIILGVLTFGCIILLLVITINEGYPKLLVPNIFVLVLSTTLIFTVIVMIKQRRE